MTVPATRTLPAVLRQLAERSDALQLLVGTYDVTSTDPTYANVILDGQTLQIPKLRSATDGNPGQPAYVLSAAGRMIVLGTID